MEDRKVIQLVSAGAGKEKRVALMALCNDGTMWILVDGGWQKLPDIPNA